MTSAKCSAEAGPMSRPTDAVGDVGVEQRRDLGVRRSAPKGAPDAKAQGVDGDHHVAGREQRGALLDVGRVEERRADRRRPWAARNV